MAARVRPTTIRPDVSLSRRWTMPGRSSPCSSRSSGKRASKPLTSVPRSLPGAGWTTTPAGLSITIIAASSNTTWKGTSSSDGRSRLRATSTISTRSPEATRWLGLLGRPLSVIASSPISRCHSARDRSGSPPWRWRKPSRRSPAAKGGTTTSRASRKSCVTARSGGRGRSAAGISSARRVLVGRRQGVQGQQCHADDNCRVGDVEHRPPVGAVAEVDEIDHVALADAVDQVADRTAQLQPEREVEAEARTRQIAIAGGDHADDQDADEHEKRRLILQQAERGAAIFDVCQAQIVAHDGHRDRAQAAALEAVLGDAFGDLIDHDDERGQAEEQQAAQWNADFLARGF